VNTIEENSEVSLPSNASISMTPRFLARRFARSVPVPTGRLHFVEEIVSFIVATTAEPGCSFNRL
jgi:hypothetical protein